MQLSLNVGVEEFIASVQGELEKMVPSDVAKNSLLKVSENLDEGAPALKTCQKHIKVANYSEYSWSTVHHYQSDEKNYHHINNKSHCTICNHMQACVYVFK